MSKSTDGERLFYCAFYCAQKEKGLTARLHHQKEGSISPVSGAQLNPDDSRRSALVIGGYLNCEPESIEEKISRPMLATRIGCARH
ncbi:hypothetical protein [Pararobbsia alpina]|uniref:hypothetical protein n=1 Tax=Pararobbsia alpina TaxID=621374 RepID=UPI001583B6E9|nr:hypothetical protein [Pararobbsia alpina]